MPEDEETTTEEVFQGYTSPNYTQVPDELFDRQLPDLSGAELKVLLYIMRRTFGFKKDADDISLNQICRGITTRDGRVLDRGTGLSKSTAQLAIKGLLAKNIILTTKRVSPEKGNEATTYELNVPSRRPYTENRHRGAMPEIGTALYRKSAPQETVRQQTDLDLSNTRKAHAEDSVSGKPEDISPGDRSGRPTARRTGRSATPRRAAKTPPGSSGAPQMDVEAFSAPALVLDDSVTRGGPSRSSADGEGFVALRDQLGRLRDELARAPTRGRPPGTRDERDLVAAYLRDFRPFLGDEAPLASSVSRAINIFKRAQIPIQRWPSLLEEANSITKYETQKIQKKPSSASNGFAAKNRAPYYFAVLEDLCGLREELESAVSNTA